MRANLELKKTKSYVLKHVICYQNSFKEKYLLIISSKGFRLNTIFVENCQ